MNYRGFIIKPAVDGRWIWISKGGTYNYVVDEAAAKAAVDRKVERRGKAKRL